MLALNKAIPPLLQKKRNFVVDDTYGIALLIATAFKKCPENYVIICSNSYNAQKVFDFVVSFLETSNCLFFPNEETPRIDSIAESKENLAQRLFVMNELHNNEPHILITSVAGLLRYLPDPKLFNRRVIKLSIGDRINPQELINLLAKSGYSRVNKIDQSLQFAARGDVVDIFSVNENNPIRIEFFDDEIESIKYFDISTQTSLKRIESCKILPAAELIYSEQELSLIPTLIRNQVERDRLLISERSHELLKQNSELDIECFLTNSFRQKLYKYTSFIQEKTFSILDYINTPTIILNNVDQCMTSAKILAKESQEYLDELVVEGRNISHLSLYNSFNRLISKDDVCIKCRELSSSETSIQFNTRPIVGVTTLSTNAIDLIKNYLNNDNQLIIALSTKQHLDLISEILYENAIPFDFLSEGQIPDKRVGISLMSLNNGFEIQEQKIVILTSKELFNYHQNASRYSTRFKEGAILKSYEDLSPGDYVVHEYHGIGQYLDLKTLEVDGVHRDFLHIAYAGSDILYVPLSQFQLVRKYIGKDGYTPRLNRLHTKEWEKTKKRIKEKVSLLADRLISLYAERSRIQGHAFHKDDELQIQFENEFLFELTEDQKTALIDIKNDMESSRVMDRLLCGDVGFGKTEVAFRAAFKAISDGKQVAILCPTTLLARQHYEVAVERFSKFGVRIALLSRLVNEQRQKEYLKGIKNGQIHMVIGTHRLLSKEVQFNDLGLLIIDEEQRFGVEQKERIKELRSNVDVLTLTATPIPRTLQISLLGIRALSQLNTPPVNRSSIQTYVIPKKDKVIKELIERELSRQGQVFYVHNEVVDIYMTASKLQNLVKDATIGVVHGQMNRDDIEDTMEKFYSGEINVLVCTSIVENGIDIPNANMIIVENAANFGLSQLYQIKGRVGRSNRIAYAYLLYNENQRMNEKASKRLKAIQDFTELGSGYKIAQRDLMIRGAGDILGSEQSGYIDSVGIDMYLKLLNEAIKEKQTGVIQKIEEPKEVLHIDAYIPKKYASKEDKIELYQSINDAKTFKELDSIRRELRDQHGKIPEEVNTLLLKRRIDISLNSFAFQNMKEEKDRIDIVVSKSFISLEGAGTKLFNALQDVTDKIQVSFINRELRIKIYKDGHWLELLDQVVSAIADIYKKASTNEKENYSELG